MSINNPHSDSLAIFAMSFLLKPDSTEATQHHPNLEGRLLGLPLFAKVPTILLLHVLYGSVFSFVIENQLVVVAV